MRYQDLRLSRGIESLWLRLRLARAHAFPQRGEPAIGDLAQLSDHQLKDIGLTRASFAPAAPRRIGL